MGQPEQLDRVLRLPEVERVTGLKRSTIYRDIQAGRFPPPVKLGKQASGWKASAIAAWIAALAPSGEGRAA
jgi:prophage regulatory protein